MYIITILTVDTKKTELVGAFNDDLIAQNAYLTHIEELTKSADPYVLFEAIFVAKNEAEIYKKETGYMKTYKSHYKTVVMHHMSGHTLEEVD